MVVTPITEVYNYHISITMCVQTFATYDTHQHSAYWYLVSQAASSVCLGNC